MDVSAGGVSARVYANALAGVVGADAGVMLVEWVQEHFRGSGELERVQDAPDSPSRIAALGQVIDVAVGEDRVLGERLEHLLEDVEATAPAVIQQAVGYQGVIVRDATVTVTIGSADSLA